MLDRDHADEVSLCRKRPADEDLIEERSSEGSDPGDVSSTEALDSRPSTEPQGASNDSESVLAGNTSTEEAAAPTYLEAMSSSSLPESSFESQRDGLSPPRQSSIRERTSTGFRGFLSRAGIAFSHQPPPNRTTPGTQMTQRRHDRASSTSLLLQPSSSRRSSATERSNPMNISGPSPSASTHSLHISSPIPNSAVRASFDLPRAGLSEEQMRFLGTPEAVNLAGMRMDLPLSGGQRRPRVSSVSSETPRRSAEDSPPSFEELDDTGSSNAAPPSPDPDRSAIVIGPPGRERFDGRAVSKMAPPLNRRLPSPL